MRIMSEKLNNAAKSTAFDRLSQGSQAYIAGLAEQYRLTHQELRHMIEMDVDLHQWDEGSVAHIWRSLEARTSLRGVHRKNFLWQGLRYHYDVKKHSIPSYQDRSFKADQKRDITRYWDHDDRKEIYGDCPVRSERTVCCNLKTIDVAVNCGFGCSYCSIQYLDTDGKVHFDADLKSKLKKIRLDPGKRVHIGTGQSTDSLMWGNQGGILDALFDFARANPNAILELKTKSKNIAYFLKNDVPPNVFCAWSLSPQTIVHNEEHWTAFLEERLTAARCIADRGIRVGFHFHPIIYYEGWEQDYAAMATQVMHHFCPEEVLFIAMGSLHFSKSVLKQIRSRKQKTKVTQMPFVKNPEGKFTYPIEIKEKLFRHVYQSFAPWHSQVFFYLCMETDHFWWTTFGNCYSSNKAFEQELLDHFERKMALCRLC